MDTLEGGGSGKLVLFFKNKYFVLKKLIKITPLHFLVNIMGCLTMTFQNTFLNQLNTFPNTLFFQEHNFDSTV